MLGVVDEMPAPELVEVQEEAGDGASRALAAEMMTALPSMPFVIASSRAARVWWTQDCSCW